MKLVNAVAAMLVVGAIGVHVPTASAQTVKIGFISTFSGPSQAFGEQMDRGVKLYMKLNADKLPKGVRVEVVTRDDGGPNPDKGKQIAQELIVRDKVNFLAGMMWTPSALAIAPLVTEAKVPFVVMNAAAPAITTRSPYIARSSYTVWQAALPAGEWAAKKYKRAYILVSDYAPGHDTEAAFEKGFAGPGRTIAGKVRVPLVNPDFVPFMQRIKDEKPDVLFYYAAAGGQQTQIIKTYKDLGMDKAGIEMVTTYLPLDEELPEAALGTTTIYYYTTAAERPANKAFVAAFRKEFNAMPDYIAVAAWDGMDLIYSAIREQKGKIDPDRSMEAMKKYRNPNSPRGPISIDPATRDIVQNIYLREVRKVGGQLVTVELETVSVAVKDPWKELNKK
jgi:branched-chain amino acid transport system substrate-binding protein